MSTENPVVFLSDGGQNETQVTYDVLISHLQNMGLKTSSLNSDWIGFAEFEIIRQNGTVKIDVGRPDGKITRCYLSQSVREENFVYLQIDSGFDPYNPDDDGKEVHGIFPARITGIFSLAHLNSSTESLNFETADGYVGVNNEGNIILSMR